ncbi:MAG TPA: PfkB family carbohydrate kinase, partial [Actinomycetota bacterium]|nr:PfkB family carbohydrate kinase [Actinomycetota bacterium]
MSIDVAVVGAPFLDIVFAGLPEPVTPGREVIARALHVGPGGTAMQAIAASREGATVALVAPRAGDFFAGLLETVVAAEGIRWIGPGAEGTSVTAVLHTRDGTAMVTAAGREEPSPADVAEADPRAVVVSLGRRWLAPADASVYAVTGRVEIDAGASLDAAAGAAALIVNDAEAAALTGHDDPEDAARRLADVAAIAIVTVGAAGAIAVAGGEVVRVRPSVASTGDATGAGDVFAGSFAASHVLGVPLPAALER